MPSAFDEAFFERVTAGLDARRDPARALAMARYMKGLFPYAGVPAPAVEQIAREARRGLAAPAKEEITAAAMRLWALPEREYQYVACGLLARNVKRCDRSLLETVRILVTTKSWWDTVDTLAANVAGPLVLANPDLAAEMDGWAASENTWLARAAILHQLRFRERTDAARLFAYCTSRAGDPEFFIRKAIGWALREYSKTDPRAVVAFVQAHADVLSPLSRREALKWLSVRESGRRAAAEAAIDLAGLAR